MARKTSALRSRAPGKASAARKKAPVKAVKGKTQKSYPKPYKVPAEFRGSGGAMEIPADAPKPSFFKMRARKLSSGSTEEPLAIGKHLWLKIKVYGKGGENKLHAHDNQDHSFIVLDGKACFHGPRGEKKTLGRGEGILLPAGSYYWFESVGKDPLVLLRAGAYTNADTPDLRVMPDGSKMVRRTADTVYVSPDVAYRDDWYE
jgi:mannose-6-phosphate isomerase-like protein (cupin superfamily)